MTRREFLKRSLLGVGAFALADASLLEPRWIEWTNIPLISRANASVPITFVQLSDLHLRSLDGHLSQAALTINKMKPDLLFITGDSIERQKDLSQFEEFMGVLDMDIPKAAVLGNWEYWGKVDLSGLRKVYERHNCRLLVNDSEVYSLRGKTVRVTGIDDYIGGDADIKTALRDYQENDYHVVLNHCPQYRDLMGRHMDPLPKIDVVLSGHTHGGQINVLGFIPVLPPGSGTYVKGWYDSSDPPIYVSRGIGMSVAPVRFGARPEITTFQVNV